MKKLLIATAVLTATLPNFASAGELIFGVKGGAKKLADEKFAPGFAVSGQVGYEFLDLVAADIAAELEYARSVAGGSIDVPGLEKAKYQTIGAYVSARSAGPVYAIGRIGVAQEKIEVETKGGQTLTDEKTGPSLGVGVGFSVFGSRTELEVTSYEAKGDDGEKSKNAYYLSLGMAF